MSSFIFFISQSVPKILKFWIIFIKIFAKFLLKNKKFSSQILAWYVNFNLYNPIKYDFWQINNYGKILN